MARVPTPFAVQDTFGNALDGTAYLYERGTTNEVDTYAAESGGSALSQPFSFSGGRLGIWATTAGSYDLEITTSIGTYTQPWEAVDGSGGGGAGAVGSWVSLTPYLETGWTGGGPISGSLSNYDLMYYIDRDRVYLR